jgi:hypothetical protein
LASISATTNTLTTGNLLSIDWSPTFWATSSGNLVNINLGAMADTTGNIFNIQDNASDIFSVNPQQIVNNLPTSFNAAGDVAIAYDINFTNPTASYLKSVAPLYLQSGELFNSSDLTLRTFNKGNIIFDANEASVFNHSATVSGNVVIGTTVAPANIGNFYLTNSDNSGKAVAIINQTDTGADLFTASAAGTPKFVIDKSGNVGIGSSAPGSTLTVTGTLAVSSTSTLTGAATLTGGFDSNAASTVTNLTVDGNSGNAITISGTSFTTDFTLQNGETIDNNTNNQIALNLGTTGTLALTNGTNLTTSLTTFNLINTTATTLNVGGAATTALNIGGGANSVKVNIANGGSAARVKFFDNAAADATLANNGEFMIGSRGTTTTGGRIWVRSTGTTFRFNSVSNVADYSEYIRQEDASEPGDVMVFATSSAETVKKSGKTYDQDVVGIVTNRGTGNNKPEPYYSEDTDVGPEYANVGMLGQVFTKVSLENGPIHVGDPLTTASESGKAMRATKAGRIIGRAMEDYLVERDTVSSTNAPAHQILVYASIGWFDPSAPPPDDNSQLAFSSQGPSELYTVSDTFGHTWNNTLVAEFGGIANLSAGKIKTEKISLSGVDLGDQIASLSARVSQLEGLQTGTESGIIVTMNNLSPDISSAISQIPQIVDELAQIQLEMASQSARLAKVEDTTATHSGQLTLHGDLLASISASLNGTLSTESGSINIATFSANFGTFYDSLVSVGTTQLGNTSIGGTLNVGLVHVDDSLADISSLNGTLSLQNGGATIDASGNLTVLGTVSAKKVETEELKVLGAKSAGSATITAGQTSVVVTAVAASSTSRILVTPTTLTDRALVVTNKGNGQFTVSIKTADIANIDFDWLVVQN